MVEPVTVFLVAIACLLAAAAAVRPLAQRTGIPEAVWLIGLGAAMRVTGLVSSATIAALAPFFAALALVIVLFEAGRDMTFGSAGEQAGRARKLALVSAVLVGVMVPLFSQGLSGLQLLPTWSWTHGLMLAALVLATAPEVFSPTLLSRAHPGLVATLERESALTGALAIAGAAVCIDLLSAEIAEGEALVAIAAGFGLGLAFGVFAGLLWITAIRRVGPQPGVYPYTLAAILGLYVITETLGGIGALAVLVFGAVVANASTLVAAIFKPAGGVVEGAEQDFRGALDDHARTVEITRVLLLMFVGLGLGPPWGLLAMGIVLGILLVVLRLLAARLVLRGLDDREFSAFSLGWPRGMLVAGLSALPHAAQVPGTESLTTLVFSAVATTCVAFAVAVRHGAQVSVSSSLLQRTGPIGQVRKDMSLGTAKPPSPVSAPAVEDLLGPGRAVAAEAGRKIVPAPGISELQAPGRTVVAEAERKTEVAPAPGLRDLQVPAVVGEVAPAAELPDLQAPGRTVVAERTTEIAPTAEAYPGTGAETRTGATGLSELQGAGRTVVATRETEVALGPEVAEGAFSVRTEAYPETEAVRAVERGLEAAAGAATGVQANPDSAEPDGGGPQEPPLLDLLNEALKTSGQELPTLSEWAGLGKAGEAKE